MKPMIQILMLLQSKWLFPINELQIGNCQPPIPMGDACIYINIIIICIRHKLINTYPIIGKLSVR